MSATLVALVLGIGAWWSALGSSGDPVLDTHLVTRVQLEAVSTPGVNPFTSPVGTDRPGVAAPAGIAGRQTGSTPGLFATVGDRPACDRPSLVANLQSDAGRAEAWASAASIRPDEIAGYAASLTPMLLRSDTAVTSYAYDNGRLSRYAAVLQGGTAVFVDSRGQPSVKCFNGDPLTPPDDLSRAELAGSPWPGFRRTAVTYVDPAAATVDSYTVIDTEQGKWATMPASPPGNGTWNCVERPESARCLRLARVLPPPR